MLLRCATVLLLSAVLASPAYAQVKLSPEQTRLIRARWAEARWTSLNPGDSLAGETDNVFVVSGELKNVGEQPIAWVKLRYDLLDSMYEVKASEYGYNRGAEALRDPQVEAGEVDPRTLDIPPIEPGAAEGFRMTFFRANVPPFVYWRVTVLEVKLVSAR